MAKRTGVVTEFFLFMKDHKAYWLSPIIIITLLLVGIVILGAVGGGAAAPFIYTLF